MLDESFLNLQITLLLTLGTKIYILNSLEYAFESFKSIESMLKLKNYSVLHLPFGWFNKLQFFS